MSQDSSIQESANRETKPYRAEYAASNRAKCKKCEENIAKDSLKLAYMVKSRFHDGYDPKHHHLDCFFQIKRPKSLAEIANFEKLKYEDQKLLEQALATNGGSVLDKSSASSANNEEESGSKKGKKRDVIIQADFNNTDFCVELAKSNRSVCVSCQEKIAKDTIRFGKLNFDAHMDAVYAAAGPIYRWHHIDCFAKNCAELEYYGDVTRLKGFGDLDSDSQKKIKKTVKPQPKEKAKKMKTEEQKSPDNSKEERRLKRQSDLYYSLREVIVSIKKAQLVELLDYMHQKSDFKHGPLLVDMATDVLLFGPLDRCPKCKGKLMLKSTAYICTGRVGEEPCNFETKDPNRKAPDVPKHIAEEYVFFTEDYVFKPRKRLFPSKLVEAVENKAAESGKIVNKNAPLHGLIIGVSSWKFIVQDKEKVDGRIKGLGAKLQTAIDKQLFILLTTEDELAKNVPKLEVAKALNVPLVKARCLFDIKSKDDVVASIKSNLVEEYDGDIKQRYKAFRQQVTEKSNESLVEAVKKENNN